MSPTLTFPSAPFALESAIRLVSLSFVLTLSVPALAVHCGYLTCDAGGLRLRISSPSSSPLPEQVESLAWLGLPV